MSESLQNIIIIIVCVLAVAYLIYNSLKKRKTKSACSNCPAMKITKKNHK